MKKNISIPLTFLLLSILALYAFHENRSTAKKASFNHLALYVYDLQKSSDFYEKVIGLQKIDEPFKDGRHNWYNIGEHCQLHLISGNSKEQSHIKDTHLAFTVPSLDEFVQHLEKEHISYSNWKGDGKTPTLRSDGVKQVYFTDPDGYWVEVNDDKY